MSKGNELLSRLNADTILQRNALSAFRSSPANFAAVRDLFFDAAGLDPEAQESVSNIEERAAVTTAIKVWIGRNQGEIARLSPHLAGHLMKPENARVDPAAEGPGVFDLIPTVGDIGEGVGNALADIRKTMMWVAIILGVILLLPRFLSRPPRAGKSA